MPVILDSMPVMTVVAIGSSLQVGTNGERHSLDHFAQHHPWRPILLCSCADVHALATAMMHLVVVDGWRMMIVVGIRQSLIPSPPRLGGGTTSLWRGGKLR